MLRIEDIDSVEKMQDWKPVIMLALTEIGSRSGGRYAPDVVFDDIADRRVHDRLSFALWLAVDEYRLSQGDKPNDAACGLTTLELIPDEVGNPMCFISRGWIRRGYKGEPFDAALPKIKAWAKRRGCVRILSASERSSMAVAPKRFDLQYLMRRLEGLASYCRWIGKRGFKMRETFFELELIQ